MTYRGTVRNGVVVLDDPKSLPDGAEVTVSELEPIAATPSPGSGRPLYERFKSFIGTAKGLPPDLAENHDHYLYGRPKK